MKLMNALPKQNLNFAIQKSLNTSKYVWTARLENTNFLVFNGVDYFSEK